MKPALSHPNFRTTSKIVRTAAVACFLAGSGCGLDRSGSTADDGALAGGPSEGATEAAAGVGASGAEAQAGSAPSADDTGGGSSAGGAPHDASKADAGDASSAGGGHDGTSKHDAGDDTSKNEAGGDTSRNDGGDDTSQHDADDDFSAGGTGEDTSKSDAGDHSGVGGAGGDTSNHDGTDEQPPPTLCRLNDGETVPYDYTYGLAQEYALDVSMDCKVGGQLMPLIMEDPDELSAVLAFESELVDWYRVQVLECPDETSSWTDAQFGLLPPNDAGVSRGDVEAAIGLFMAVLDRHDGSADGMTSNQKRDVRERLEQIGAVSAADSDEVTMPLDMPECAPEEDT